jgi:hypothetical protein
MGIFEPCGHQKGYQRIVAIYIKYLISGVNFRNKDFLRLATVWGYMTSINLLFRLRSMEAPVDTYLTPTTWRASSSTTSSRKRILRDSVAYWTAVSLPSCFKSWTYLVCWIRNSHLIWPRCPLSLHWSLCERIHANYGQERGLPCVPFQEASDQGVYCKGLSFFWQE